MNAFVDRYIEKWDKIIFSKEPVDRAKAETAIIKAYSCIDLSPPEIYFFTSPSLEQCSIFKSIDKSFVSFVFLKAELLQKTTINRETIDRTMAEEVIRSFQKYQEPANRGEKFHKLCAILYEQYLYDLAFYFNIYKMLDGEHFRTNCCWFYDLYFENSNSRDDREIWHIFKSLCEECPYLILYDGVCIVIDRPIELHLDRELLPHAEGKPAIKYADGFEVYCNLGFRIPPKYGSVHPSNWQAQWILSEEEYVNDDNAEVIDILLFNIGYKKFREELPEFKDRFWYTDKRWRFTSLMDLAFEYIIMEWLRFHYYGCYSGEEGLEWNPNSRNTDNKIDNFPCVIPEDLRFLYWNSEIYLATYPIAPRLSFISLEQAILRSTLKDNSYAVPILEGDRGEIYYVNCDNIKRNISPIYCQFPNEEPIIYAECVTALFAAIAECYRSEAYYITIDEETGKRSIEQDLDRVELSFEKFNPEQIDNWRKVWRR